MNKTGKIVPPEIVPGNVIATLRNCDGVYECPMDADGKPVGPLIGYAGTYDGPDGKLLNYVGFVYYNVGKGDQWPHITEHWARTHAQRLAGLNPDLLVAAPMGGISYMSVLKQALGCRGIFAEKKVIETAKEGQREKSKLILGRYEVNLGDRVVIVEDIINNFSTTNDMIKLIEAAGGIVVALTCIINRSDKTCWEMGGRKIPVISLQHRPTPQYRQDDPAVARYIAVKNDMIIWKPKDRWDELKAIEGAHSPASNTSASEVATERSGIGSLPRGVIRKGGPNDHLVDNLRKGWPI